MTVHNREIAAMLSELADLLEIEGANAFRVRAYREGARAVSGLSESLADLVARDQDLSKLSGIGRSIAQKIETIVETGSLSQLEQAEKRVPATLADIMHLDGLGPKRVKVLHEQLGIDTLDDLREAVEAGAVRRIEGFGKKIEDKIRHELRRHAGQEKRTLLAEAEQIAQPLLDHLRQAEGIKQLIIAGSYRRRKETVGDIDILVSCRKGAAVMDHFVAYDQVQQVQSKGRTRSTVRLRSGMQVDLRVVPQVSYGAALYYFTGSRAHNIALRKRAVKRGLKINEYGVYAGDERIAGRTEEEVAATVDLPLIAPELRENEGEIQAAREDRLPQLLTVDHIRGDLHAHTTASDGHNSLREMAEAAAERGYEYLAITDHSQHVTVAGGLDRERLARQIADIDRLNEELDGRIRLLKGIEVDILADGSLDLPDDILGQLDLRVCSVHYRFNLTEQEQTERVLRAMDNPLFNILAHPSGRLIGRREPYAIDLEAIMQAAVDRGCLLELNAQPSRLDLNDRACRAAKKLGLKVVISTDAHSIGQLDNMRFGIDQARRGWLEADDVLNTRSLEELRAFLDRS